MPVYRSFPRKYATAFALAARMPEIMRLMLAEFVNTDTECVYTWRGLMERTTPENRILLSGTVLDRYLPN